MSDEFIASVVDEAEVTVRSLGRGHHRPGDAEQTPCSRHESVENPPNLDHQPDSEEHLFERFKELFRRSRHPTEESSGGCATELEMRQKIEASRYLWRENVFQTAVENNSRETEGTSSLRSGWDRARLETPVCEGIEGWMKQVEVPDVPDNRIKILFSSACAELKKVELGIWIRSSLLQTDPGLCASIVQLQINRTVEKLGMLKYTVETIEDVLSLLSDSTLEPTLRNSLVGTLATTLNENSLKDFLQFSYVRDLIVLSFGVLLENDWKLHAAEVLRTAMFGALGYGEPVPSDARTTMLTNIIERCTAEELRWLRRDVLALYVNNENSLVSGVCEAVTQSLLRKLGESDREGVMQGRIKAVRPSKKQLSRNCGSDRKQS